MNRNASHHAENGNASQSRFLDGPCLRRGALTQAWPRRGRAGAAIHGPRVDDCFLELAGSAKDQAEGILARHGCTVVGPAISE
jgi:hypothetical protein